LLNNNNFHRINEAERTYRSRSCAL
jgi:hypothetical protein